ncbi:MAG TPA: xanthine dehydrogenase family protein molybdopterin-binding subunit [Xanthobacteraceae bacterium]|jgi:carbon-monoxide dehydrogenase large subunit|nr:xanthine dehydrogenase family protein molybdopterin-binding subunit [Xanthobacteraceae bacterium]
MKTAKFGFGQAVPRIEDEALMRGAGHYIDDHAPSGALHAVVIRSPHAHARFRFVDVKAARALSGVKLVLTAEDIADLGSLPCEGLVPGIKMDVPPYPILADGIVRHVGDAVAFVVADSIDRAKDAAEALAIEWEVLPHVVEGVAALENGAPLVWSHRASNQAFLATLGDKSATDNAFAKADRVVSLTLVNQRLVTNYLDTRGVVAEYDSGADRFTLTLGSQSSHMIRDILCQAVLKIPTDNMRVVAPDIGGGFGTKYFPYREYALAAIAAKRLLAPVKWVADRTEHFLGDAQGRDNVTTAKLALDAKGRFLALDVDTVADMGAYLSCFAPYIPYIGAVMLPGVYDIPACHIQLRGSYTNTVPVDAYRGAGRPEAAYVIERLVDTAARELGMAPDVIRRKNFIRPKAMPFTTATGKIYDSGEFANHMARALEIGDWAGFKRRVAQSKKMRRLRGIGLATYIEACGNNGPETAKVRVEADGSVTVLIGSQSTGQGHHTAYAQLIADHLDLPPDRVRVIQGDTDLVETGVGTGGSSSIPCGGASVSGAARKLADNLKSLAADRLEASVADLEIADGHVRIAGTDRALSFADIAAGAKDKANLLTTQDAFAPSEATYPNGTHLAEVEIDPDTGGVHIANYVVIDDFGLTLNPLMLAGQIHGGAVQGLGQALMERTVYDAESGQLLSASLMDYALPRADDVPFINFETKNVKCKTNALGVKGAGEAGAIGSCPALMNAIVDALWRAYRIRHVDMPATPERLWQTIEEGRRVHTL